MPRKSLNDRIRRLERVTAARFVEALLVVVEPDGTECYRAGGLWDRQLRRYDRERPCEPFVFRLQRSQVEASRAFGRWLDASRSDQRKRSRLLFLGGAAGSGKTTVGAGPETVACALEWPGEVQFVVSLQAKNRRECVAALRQASRPEWITFDRDSPSDARTGFLTGSWLAWLTARNPSALRQRKLPIRRVVINEAQEMPVEVFANSMLATRNTGGLVTILANPSQDTVGEWVCDLWEKMEGRGLPGEQFLLDPAQNEAIDQEAQTDIGNFLRVVAPDAYAADVLGDFSRDRGRAYPGFRDTPREADAEGRWIRGHIGRPPPARPDGTLPWRDVTRELTAEAVGGGGGWDWVGGSDFQRSPGCCISVGKLYRDERDELLLYLRHFIGAPGDEHDLTQAIVSAGYYPGDTDFQGRAAPGSSLLIVGDGTGAIQDAFHRRGNPYSFTALIADGWKVIPPMRHYKSGSPCNPEVLDSRKQMNSLLAAGRIVFDPACTEPAADFPSLVDGFKRTKLMSSGKFEKRGHFTHGPDGVRYLAWSFMPRPKTPPVVHTAPDLEIFKMLAAIRPQYDRGLR